MKQRPNFKIGQRKDENGNIIAVKPEAVKANGKPKNVNAPAKIGRRSGTRGS